MSDRAEIPQSAPQSHRRSWISATFEAVVVVAILLLIVLFVWRAPTLYDSVYSASASTRSAGDKFTALTALFTALAFAALIYATWLQRRELALQRQELSLTRDELTRQRQQMESQNATLAAQRFENTFFQLLRVHQHIVGALREYE